MESMESANNLIKMRFSNLFKDGFVPNLVEENDIDYALPVKIFGLTLNQSQKPAIIFEFSNESDAHHSTFHLRKSIQMEKNYLLFDWKPKEAKGFCVGFSPVNEELMEKIEDLGKQLINQIGFCGTRELTYKKITWDDLD